MNALAEQFYTEPLMSDLSKEEIQSMIEASVTRGVDHGMDGWQNRYGLRPEHWVFLKTQYVESKANRRTMKDNVINAITNTVMMLIALGAVTFMSKVIGG